MDACGLLPRLDRQLGEHSSRFAARTGLVSGDRESRMSMRCPGLANARFCPDRRLSELPWSIDVGAVLDGHDVAAAVLVIDAVDHPVVAAAGAVQPVEPA
jgi:hypothetical protein